MDISNEQKTKEWNECISPRLESLRAWFSSDDWTKGINSYLGNVLQGRRQHLERQGNDALTDQFIKGQISMLREIMEMPSVIGKQIELVEKNKLAGPKGDAGY